MMASIKAEALRLRKWPTMWILVGVWLALNLTFAYLFNYLAYRSGESENGVPPQILLQRMLPGAVPETFTQGMAMFGGALMLILGALATGSGYGWGTWKTVFTQGRSRIEVLAGTIVAVFVVVVGVVLSAFVLDLGVAAIIATSADASTTLPTLSQALAGIGTGIAILGMWTLFGVLIGVVARGPALAVGLGLVWVLVVENLLRGVGALLGPVEAVTDWLPGTAAGSLAGAMRSGPGDAVPGVLDTLTRPESLVALAVYVAVMVGATLLIVRRRDLV